MQLVGQRGMGLIEVMVALMLLAIAILGFSAMQLTSVKATDESLMRGNAMTVMRGGAEMMRANPIGIQSFITAINGTANTVEGVTKDDCVPGSTKPTCSINQLAARDGLVTKQYAKDNNIKIRVETCPGTGGAAAQPLSCFIASWGATNATIGASNTDCLKDDGTYNTRATCFVMEAY